MLRRLILACSIACAASVPAAADSLTYCNDRFGTQLTFPAELFETRADPPENGDGMAWSSAEGSSLTVYGSYNALEATPAGMLREIVEARQAAGQVTYSRAKDNWVVVSGFAGQDVFYERHVFGRGDVIHSMILTYPRQLAGKYNPLVGPIANSLGGP